MQKYVAPKLYKMQFSRLPKCCVRRDGLVKKRFPKVPKNIPAGQESYPCKNGGYHLRTIRN